MTAQRPLHVLSSNGVRGAVTALLPVFEAETGIVVTTSWNSAAALAEAIERGTPFDLAILTAGVAEALIATGHLVGPALPIARVGIGVAVRAGAPQPDITTATSFRSALLAARSVAFTTQGASGVYFASLLKKLGIADEIAAKAKTRPGGLIAELVARGEAELAIQQMSELRAVAGVDVVGPLPDELQHVTVFAAGLAAAAGDPESAHRLLQFLTSAQAQNTMPEHGLEHG